MSEMAFLQLEKEVISLPISQLRLLQQAIAQELSFRSQSSRSFFSDQDIPESKKAFFDAIGKLHFDKDTGGTLVGSPQRIRTFRAYGRCNHCVSCPAGGCRDLDK